MTDGTTGKRYADAIFVQRSAIAGGCRAAAGALMWGQYSAAARDLTPEEKLKVVRQVRAALPERAARLPHLPLPQALTISAGCAANRSAQGGARHCR